MDYSKIIRNTVSDVFRDSSNVAWENIKPSSSSNVAHVRSIVCAVTLTFVQNIILLLAHLLRSLHMHRHRHKYIHSASALAFSGYFVSFWQTHAYRCTSEILVLSLSRGTLAAPTIMQSAEPQRLLSYTVHAFWQYYIPDDWFGLPYDCRLHNNNNMHKNTNKINERVCADTTTEIFQNFFVFFY